MILTILKNKYIIILILAPPNPNPEFAINRNLSPIEGKNI